MVGDRHRRGRGYARRGGTIASAAAAAIVSCAVAAHATAPGTLTERPSPANPYAVVSGPDGNMWFTERNLDAIGRMTPAGVVTSFPLPSASPSNPDAPEAIVAGPDGALWFTEQTGNRIGRITTDGTITEYPLPTARSYPSGIALGPDGNLWFTELDGNRIGRITTAGAITEFTDATMTNNKEGPFGITAGPDGNMYFTDYNVGYIGDISTGVGANPTPGVIGRISNGSDLGNPDSIALGPDGAIWFTNNQTQNISRFVPGGNGTINRYPLSDPPSDREEDLTVGPDGNLWLTGTSAVARVTPAGSVTEYPMSGSTTEPVGIATGPDGGLWFAQYGASEIGDLASGAPSPSQTPPAISGQNQAGSPEQCGGEAWNAWASGPPATTGVLWLRDGSSIPSATQRSYTPTSADVGHALSCRVIVEYPGPATWVSADSPPVSITSAGSSPGGTTTTTTTTGNPPSPAPPRVFGLVPHRGSGFGGTSVDVYGSGFTGATRVAFGGTPATSFRVVSNSEIASVSPAHDAGAVDVTVTTPSGTSATSSADSFMFAGPMITTVSGQVPASGGDVGLFGTDLAGATVTIAGQPAHVYRDDDTLIALHLPPGNNPTRVQVSNADGTAEVLVHRYAYPILMDVEPGSGLSTGGYQATITGINLRTGDQVLFGRTPARLTATSGTLGSVTVPHGGRGYVRVTVKRSGQPTPRGAGRDVVFQYVPPCRSRATGGCEFLAWAEAQLQESSTPISDYQADKPTGFAQTVEDPRHGAVCADYPVVHCRYAQRPVYAHVTHSLIGANGGAAARVSPFGSEIDVTAEAQGPVPQDATKPGHPYVDANGYTDNGSSASGHAASIDAWSIEPQPSRPVPVYVAVSTRTRAIVSISSGFPSYAAEALADWSVSLNGTTAAGSEHYHFALVGQPGSGPQSYSYLDDNTLTVNGHPAPGGATTMITAGPIDISPSEASGIRVLATLDASVNPSCGDETSGALCTGSAQASVDPVVISADPHYQVLSTAPARAAGQPLILASSALTARRGARLILTGGGFGSSQGAVVFVQGRRTVVGRLVSWSPARVVVAIPHSLSLAGSYVRVRTGSEQLSNPVPLTVRGSQAPPVLQRISRSAARRGARLRVFGENLRGVRRVLLGATPARILSRSARDLTVRVPKGDGTVYVTLVGRGGASAQTTAGIFSYRG